MADSEKSGSTGAGPEVPREGGWGAAGVTLLVTLFVLGILATLHALITTVG